MAWIELHDTVKDHKKTWALCEHLDIPNAYAVGLLACLWTWALTNATNGDLSDFPCRAIARGAGWEGDAGQFVQALQASGYVDDHMMIHDWHEYTVLYQDSEAKKKEKTKERVRRFRAQKDPKEAQQEEDVTPCNADVTHCNADTSVTCNADVTHCNASTVPNLTVPNLTVPNLTVPDQGNGNSDGMRRPHTPKTKFSPPSADEVGAYCLERRNGVDPQRFVDFYAAKGWLVGKSPMKDWRAAVRTWEQNTDSRSTCSAQASGNPFVRLLEKVQSGEVTL